MNKKLTEQTSDQVESRWLRYSKTILEKVSFDSEIFRKELVKSLKRLSPPERRHLEAWCINSLALPMALLAIQIIQDYG